MTEFGAIGVLALSQAVEEEGEGLLSDRERARLSRIRSPERRRGWIGSRLVTKFLFLDRWRYAIRGDDPGGRPAVVRLTWSALDEMPRWAYRAVDVLPRDRQATGVPRLQWAGRLQTVHISLAHTSRLAVACLDSCRPVGMDVEMVEPRSRAFRRVNFSAREREWIDTMCSSERIGEDQIYTLLWSLKESALKSEERDDSSVWRLSGTEVLPRCSQRALVELFRGTRREPVESEADIRSPARTFTADVILTAEDDAVITTVRVPYGGRE